MSENTAVAPVAQSEGQSQPEERQQTRSNGGQFQGKHPVQESQRQAQQAKATPTGELNKRAADVGKTDAAPPPKPEPRKFKFKEKVYGEEQEVEYDEESLVRALQMGKGAQKRMQEAAEKEKRAEAMMQAFKSGDQEALKQYEVDLDALAERRLAERARRELVPQHELEAEELKAENARLKLERQHFEEQQKRASEEAQLEVQWKELQPQFEKAAEEFDLPRDHATMKLIAAVGDEFAAAGVDLSPKQIVAEVSRRQEARITRYVVAALKQGPEALDRFLAKSGLKDSYLEHLSKEDAKRRGLPPQRREAAEPETKDPRKLIFSDSDWKKSLGR